jgi:hypothetical protein
VFSNRGKNRQEKFITFFPRTIGHKRKERLERTGFLTLSGSLLAPMKKQTNEKQKDPVPRLAYTPEEAGRAIGRHSSWVYRQIYLGNLRVSASFGKRAMIPAAELERFVNRLGEYEVRNIGRRAHKAYREKQLAEAAE